MGNINVRNALTIEGVQAPKAVTVRNVVPYAALSVPSAVYVRQTTAYGVLGQTNYDRTQTTEDNLYRLLAQVARGPVTKTDIGIKSIRDVAGPTSVAGITVTSLNTAKFKGDFELQLKRVGIDYALQELNGVVLGFNIPSDTTTHALIPQINTAYNTKLATTDIKNDPVKAGVKVVKLRAADAHPLFTPGSVLFVGISALSSYVKQDMLDGFGDKVLSPNTRVLMHFDAPDNSSTFVDEMSHPITVEGSPIIIGNQMRGGTALTNRVWMMDSPDLRMLGDFTMEFFLTLDNTANQNAFLIAKDPANNVLQYFNGSYYLRAGANPYLINNVPAGLTPGVRTHVALTKVGTTYRIFTGGVLKATATSSNAFGDNGQGLYINSGFNPTTPFQGLFDELRITNGVGLYTTNFTPPTGPFTR